VILKGDGMSKRLPLTIDGFQAGLISTQHASDGEILISYQMGGSGPPLLLLHGFPQTKMIWHRVAPALAKHFTVIASDLRGYGASSKPQGLADHSTYSKRAMASDQAQLMNALGFSHYGVLGHDRGGRVAHRLALDYGKQVNKLMVLDISPTLAMYEQTTMQFASSYWHWFFLIQKAPIPETMIGANTEFFMKQFMGGRHAGLSIFAPECWQEYVLAMSDPACLHAMCEDYRAAASIDLEHDRQSIAQKQLLEMPVRVLWGEFGQVNACFKPLEDWQKLGTDVSGQTLQSGHYIPEEIPEGLIAEARAFFAAPA
jgi:haloacetate dehalogenase